MKRLPTVEAFAGSALLAFAPPGTAVGEDYAPCAESNLIVEACWNVRGRVAPYNGNPTVRIWPVGSNRMLGVRDAEPPLLPPALGKMLSWDAYVYADLKVCPLTNARKGRMQIVCIAGARNAVVRER